MSKHMRMGEYLVDILRGSGADAAAIDRLTDACRGSDWV